MKTILTLAAALALATVSIQAGPETIIKQRAKDLRDQNNARQGVQPAPSAPAPQPARAAVAPPQTPAQQSMARFQAGLALVKPGTPATAAQKQRLTADLLGMVQGGKPTHTAAQKFIENLTAALAEKQLSAGSRSRLVQNLDGLLNPSKYPQAKPSAIIDDVQSIFVSAGLARTQAEAIAGAVKTLSSESQKALR